MTAINVITKRDRVAILTDTAGYDAEGIVNCFYSKCSAIPHLKAAIATRGSALAAPLFAASIGAMFQSFDELREGAGSILERLYDSNFAQLVQSGETEVDIFLAGWSDALNRPVSLCTSSSDRHGFAPWSMQECEPITAAPMVSEEQLEEAGFDLERITVESFKPSVHGPMLMEAQRRVKHYPTTGEDSPPCHLVGGSVVLTEISATGITQSIVHRWPDRIGERIQPAPPSEARSTIPLNRQQRRALERANRR